MAHYIFSEPARFIIYILSLAFVAGILQDLDHPFHWFMGIGNSARFAHPIFAVTGVVFIGCGLGILYTLYRRLA